MMTAALDNVEKCWLGDGRPYLTGNKICVADILAACEIEQPSKFLQLTSINVCFTV